MYITIEGEHVTEEEIRSAFNKGYAVLVHTHSSNGRVITGLSLDGNHYDTRLGAFSHESEKWTSIPVTVGSALDASRI